MSRGGRGGFGRGRGGSGMGIGGASFGGDDLKPDYSVTELFPPQPPPVQSSLTKEERAMVARHRSHREKIHNGPMYTVMVRNRGKEDPFNDVGKYSSKYTRQSRKAPKLDARPYVYDLFPSELYPTIGKDGSAGSKKRLLFSALDSLNRLDELPDAEDGDAEDGDEADRKKSGLLVGAEDLDHDADDGGSDEEPDDFADDEEGDYNAEQYFEDGDDIGDDYGDDDGGGYFD